MGFIDLHRPVHGMKVMKGQPKAQSTADRAMRGLDASSLIQIVLGCMSRVLIGIRSACWSSNQPSTVHFLCQEHALAQHLNNWQSAIGCTRPCGAGTSRHS